MTKKRFTTEELTSRWEDMREIENVIGRISFLHMGKKDTQIWRECWCRKAADPCLALNNGAYKGYDAISEFFAGCEKLTALRTELTAKAYPEKLSGKSLEEIHGVGSLAAYNFTTPIVKLAGDGKTAKGMWYVMGYDTDIGQEGPRTNHSWGRLGVDFVKEDGKWLVWHMVYAEEIACPTGASWVQPAPAAAAKPEFAAIGRFELTKPNVAGAIYEGYGKDRPLMAFPQIPEAYESFADTFSYGC